MTKILVISMDKAGSTSVMNAIRSADIPVGRMHRNNVNEINKMDYTHYVAMCREPISKAISTFWEAKLAGKTIDIEQEVEFTLNFFEDYVRPMLGINITHGATVFDRKRGWTIFSERLLVVRMEDFDTGLADGLGELIGFPSSVFTVEHRAIGDERFGSEYVEFKKNTKFDEKYLWKVYESEYAKKFYYMKECQEFIKKWKK